jgi:hypothetical protein
MLHTVKRAKDMEDKLSAWENEGGSVTKTLWNTLSGTVNQIEWAERIRLQVDAEFDRVSGALKAVARKQSAKDRADTYVMISILEDKRTQVLANPKAGYFIHDWQELRDQVRKMIMQDNRYKAIKAVGGRGQL